MGETVIFVFGSNLAGRHGAGAARAALQLHGAVYGQGEGRQGNSYAIPTKDFNIETLPLTEIRRYIGTFVNYAADHPDESFNVTRVGCGLAGYCEDDISPLFAGAPVNCHLPEGWRAFIEKRRQEID